MKLSDYFKITKPNYIYLKATPMTSIRNYNSDQIAKAVASLYKTLVQRFEIYNRQFCLELPVKLAYFIYVEKTRAEFYFIIPEIYLTLIEDKIRGTWKGITLTKVDKLPTFSDDAIKYAMNYKKEDALSLAVDKRTNALLSSLLNVIGVMVEGDKVGILYNFIPINQYDWRATHKNTMQKLIDGKSVDKNKITIFYGFKFAFALSLAAICIVMGVFDGILGNKAKESKNKHPLVVTEATNQKKNKTIIGMQGVIMSESADRHRCINNAVSICKSYDLLTGDNEIICNRFKGSVNQNKQLITDVEPIKLSPRECQQLIALPGRELLEAHNCIERINTHESQVPKQLRNGTKCIGFNTYRGQKTNAYLTSHVEYKNLAHCIAGPNRSGKSTFLQNIIKNAIDNGECVIVPDYISWCKFSHELCGVIPKEKQLIIDLGDLNNMQGMGYNELWLEGCTELERYDMAKRQTAQLTALIDSINDKELSGKMGRYTKSAALITFYNYGSIGDVFDVLKNHKKRRELMRNCKSELLEEYVDNLTELDEKKNSEVVGTKMHLVAGVLDRVEKLRDNTAMEIMLKTSCENNLNLLDEMQKNQLIILQMPESRFSTEQEKDIICTYWFSKIWLSLQLRDTLIKDRKKRTLVNLVYDEMYQIEFTQSLISRKLNQIAKMDSKLIISAHYVDQLKYLKQELKGANTSFMLVQGCTAENYNEIANKLKPYTVDDLMRLKEYQSLNCIKYEDGYAQFITQLPPPIKRKGN